MCPQRASEICQKMFEHLSACIGNQRLNLKSFCQHFHLTPDRLWKFAQKAVGHSPREVKDWVRAKAFLHAARCTPTLKLHSLRQQLGFKSESAFQAFARRAFGCSPHEAKVNVMEAERKMQDRYGAIGAWYEARKNSVENEEEKQTRYGQKVLTPSENRSNKPKQQTEATNRSNKPKQQTEATNRSNKPKAKVLGKKRRKK
jgi:AraC-like DNA-binding protein